MGTTASKGSGLGGAGSGVLFGGLTAAVSLTAIGKAWAACDIGVNASANNLTLLFLTPLLWIAAAVPWTALYRTLGRRHRGAAPAAGLAFSLWFTWLAVTRLGMPDDHPASFCPDNVPPWWPGFLPA
ncbi:hypothetical protein [Streptomyces thermolilacinus]|uniref:Uncharacterized protein n=1 Tax=Streptomyces thermolilacinus SPC6 TaxID=1306406 RepID=A0A1D3DSD9_9ACTN|nr:hypothetical protein [Streptomyces thermolilacinus]OEJ95238.1 hypothetical protein J116_012830 [Streptomyces thermolilacinus SPC6]